MAPSLLLALPAALTAAVSVSLPAGVPVAAAPARSPAPAGWAAHALPSVTAHSTGSRRHTVASGETLFDLAGRYGTSVTALAATNGITNPGLIRVGQTLTIPAGSAATGAARSTSGSTTVGNYTVRPGDTLSDIAVATGTSVNAICTANGISAAAFIHPGQTLRLPGAGSAAAQRPAASPGSTSQSAAPGSTQNSSPGTGTAPAPTAAPWADTMPGSSAIRNLISSTATAYGVDPRLALAISWQESGWRQEVTSGVGAVGAMQVMPDSGTWAGGLIGRNLDLSDPHDNVTAGVVILRQLGTMTTDRDNVIAAYYQGLGSVRERGWYADTRQYVANVNYFMSRL